MGPRNSWYQKNKTPRSLIKRLCEFNSCNPEDLIIHLFFCHKENESFIKKLNLRTNHLKQNISVNASKLSCRGSNKTMAFRGFLNITVQQYYYAKHKINLRYPYIPTVEVNGGGDHKSYFPIECLSIY